ncbi:MAG TPA: chemotaxis-specific protein-glutamate methyltransferase CheB [Pirellulales bacterium]|nr:chemotaxis-specific protein-glutamate methyltransferase CheB [Pirellulales bacterium]
MTEQQPIQVMIVEDSRVVREMLEHVINLDPRLRVAASCSSAEQALQLLSATAPDVISMDIHLPGMNGLEATRRIMEIRPTPIVVVSRSVRSRDQTASIEALQAGALAVLEKPVSVAHADYQAMSHRLCTQLADMSKVKVVRQRFNRSHHSRIDDARMPPRDPLTCASSMPSKAAGEFAVVGVVASTGGPHALEVIFSQLKADFRLPIVVVQHITPSFHEGFVDWLNHVSPLQVYQAVEGLPIEPRHVYVAPKDRHLLVKPTGFSIGGSAPDNGHCPSGTVLFRSLAERFGSRAIGVLLTGMGRDGADGLLAMKRAGAFTIAEHESSAIVNGMPGTARELGAECVSLPLSAIAGALRQLSCNSRKNKPCATAIES